MTPMTMQWTPYPATPPAPGWYYHLDRTGNMSAWHLHICREDNWIFTPGQPVWGTWDCALSCSYEQAARFVTHICRIPDPPEPIRGEEKQ